MVSVSKKKKLSFRSQVWRKEDNASKPKLAEISLEMSSNLLKYPWIAMQPPTKSRNPSQNGPHFHRGWGRGSNFIRNLA